jgi:hypothetical protein
MGLALVTPVSELRIAPYSHQGSERWNTFIAGSNEGTIFHRLDFLAYHGDRFRCEEHHVAWYKGEALFGVMPMAISSQRGRRIARSPYGGSYGGPAFEKPLNYADGQEVVRLLLRHLAERDVDNCRLVLPISCCSREYSDTFRLVLLEHGFRCVNRDISSVVKLGGNAPISALMPPHARRMARKARRAGVELAHRGNLTDFWAVLEKTFQKHDARPTHTREDFEWLCQRLPQDVYVDVAYLDGRPIAGIGYMVTNQRVVGSFYLCQDPEAAALQGQSLLIHDALERSQQGGFEWLDLGTSSVNQVGRDNLFRFKEGFGAIGLFRETYEWEA